MGAGGAQEDAARTLASGCLGGRAGEGSDPHASVLGTGSLTPLARHPAPVPQTRVSTPARAQEGGRRGGGRAGAERRTGRFGPRRGGSHKYKGPWTSSPGPSAC